MCVCVSVFYIGKAPALPKRIIGSRSNLTPPPPPLYFIFYRRGPGTKRGPHGPSWGRISNPERLRSMCVEVSLANHIYVIGKYLLAYLADIYLHTI